jgi:hypothetical protein
MNVAIEATEGEITALCELLDMAVRANGLSACERAGFWVQKLQASIDAAKANAANAETVNGAAQEAVH